MLKNMVGLALVLLLSAGILTDALSQSERASVVEQFKGAEQKACLNYLTSNYLTPEDYVVRKFQDHDIIFVGEAHHVKQNLEFLHRLIPVLHQNGVFYLGYEFALYEDQGMIDRLITANEYDEKMALKIVTNKSVGMGKQEYVDVFRAAWEVNHKLPKSARRFRIIGVNINDKREYWLPSESHREKNRARNMEVGGHFYDVVNKFWAEVIWKEFISRGEKALIWAGSCHTPTRFRIDRRPRLEHYISAGNFIYNFIEDQAMYIALHGASCYGDLARAPVSDFIEAIMQKVPGAEKGAGFDTVGTPFGDLSLPDEIKGWSAGKIADFKMSDLSDGYCYLVPRAEFKPDTPMDFK